MQKKITSIYLGTLLLNIILIIGIFFALSNDDQRAVYFYFQMSYISVLSIIFWVYQILSVKDRSENQATIFSLTGGSILVFMIVSLIGAALYSKWRNNDLNDKYYYSVVGVVTFIFIAAQVMLRNTGAHDEQISNQTLKKREDLKTLAGVLEGSLVTVKNFRDTVNTPESRDLYEKFRGLIELMNRKIPDRSKLSILDDITIEVETISRAISGLQINNANPKDIISGVEKITSLVGRL